MGVTPEGPQVDVPLSAFCWYLFPPISWTCCPGKMSTTLLQKNRVELSQWGGDHRTIEESLLQVPGRKWPVASPRRVGEVAEQNFLQKTPANLCLPLHSHAAPVGEAPVCGREHCDCHLPASHPRPVNPRSSGFLHCRTGSGWEDAYQ